MATAPVNNVSALTTLDTAPAKSSRTNEQDFLALLNSGKSISSQILDKDHDQSSKKERARKQDETLSVPLVGVTTEMFTQSKPLGRGDSVEPAKLEPRAEKEYAYDDVREDAEQSAVAPRKPREETVSPQKADAPQKEEAVAATGNAEPVEETPAAPAADETATPVEETQATDGTVTPLVVPFKPGDKVSMGEMVRAVSQMMEEFFDNLQAGSSQPGFSFLQAIQNFLTNLHQLFNTGVYPGATAQTPVANADSAQPIIPTATADPDVIPVLDGILPGTPTGIAGPNVPTIPVIPTATTADKPVDFAALDDKTALDEILKSIEPAQIFTPKAKTPEQAVATTLDGPTIELPMHNSKTDDKQPIITMGPAQNHNNAAVPDITGKPAANQNNVSLSAVTSATDQASSNAGKFSGHADMGMNRNSSNPLLFATNTIGQSSAATHPSNITFARVMQQTQHAPLQEQVMLHIKTAMADGSSQIRIKLDPEELGKLDIKLHVNADGKTGVVIIADNKDTLELLQRDARGLEQALNEAGLKADSNSLSFNLREQHERQHERSQNAKNYQKQAEEEDDQVALAVMSKHYVINLADGLDIKI